MNEKSDKLSNFIIQCDGDGEMWRQAYGKPGSDRYLVGETSLTWMRADIRENS